MVAGRVAVMEGKERGIEKEFSEIEKYMEIKKCPWQTEPTSQRTRNNLTQPSIPCGKPPGYEPKADH